ncbi:YesN/AraC family two-component response regulator [Hydrogenoanaerobacterium saccharovorans]|uniref:Stage 0 sporulation protein A homolog n=1 Tax=Hydrogenoanaerobacterium saccharovorans TaxID=474960 RepID=A0A1H8DFS3_9FIRM|nr:response regulator [Hydrogenoanaerobacterium saccharovorans]RPF42169.1 YesN/AraC family two-component response regulator [Hydrogenoanaerobacterium saccharovorans]SEN05654.1 Two-component response regulator, YesN/AraC family, consists of REC and AraC-type DNA-binding domains [Hydrogenoanaerobacterium saccharovorans]
MYRILLVDDEPLVRLKIKSLLNWENYGYEISAEAGDGKDALDLLECSRFDIILTDINMPKLSGIEFIKAVKSKNPNIPILVLSAYNDYIFVREAFKLGAVDYILKNEMTGDGILQLLKRCIDEQRGKQITDDQKSISAKVKKAKILEKILCGEKIEPLEHQMQELDINLSPKNLVVVRIIIDNYKLMQSKYDDVILTNLKTSVFNMLEQKMREFKLGEVIGLSNRLFVYLMSFEKDNSISAIQQKIHTVLTSISYSFKEFFNLSITCGVSDMMDGFESITKLYEQAISASELRMVYGTGKIITQRDVRAVAPKKIHFNEDLLHELIHFLDCGNSEQVDDILNKFCNSVKALCIVDINDAYSFYSEVLYIAVGSLSARGIKINEIFHEHINFYEKITRLETIDDMNNWFCNTMRYIHEEIKNRNANKNYKLQMAVAYIKQHYTENINLKVVSDYCDVSETYLSRIFTANNNESFIGFVTKLRIQKAKELMCNSNLPISEIAEQVGYESQEHFSRIFKKHTGKSPSNYRSTSIIA